MKQCTTQRIINKRIILNKRNGKILNSQRPQIKKMQPFKLLSKQNEILQKIIKRYKQPQMIGKQKKLKSEKYIQQNKQNRSISSFDYINLKNQKKVSKISKKLINCINYQVFSFHNRHSSLNNKRQSVNKNGNSVKQLQFPVPLKFKKEDLKTKVKKSCSYNAQKFQLPTKKIINYHKEQKMNYYQKETIKQDLIQNVCMEQNNMRKNQQLQKGIQQLIKVQKRIFKYEKESERKLLFDDCINIKQQSQNQLLNQKYEKLQTLMNQTRIEKKEINYYKDWNKGKRKISPCKFVTNPFQRLKTKKKINFYISNKLNQQNKFNQFNQQNQFSQQKIKQPQYFKLKKPQYSIDLFSNDQISIIKLNNNLDQFLNQFLSDKELFTYKIFDI